MAKVSGEGVAANPIILAKQSSEQGGSGQGDAPPPPCESFTILNRPTARNLAAIMLTSRLQTLSHPSLTKHFSRLRSRPSPPIPDKSNHPPYPEVTVGSHLPI